MQTSPFDTYAKEYDKHFTFSPIGLLQRKRVFYYLVPHLNKRQSVLELNCGTGEDALMMAPLVKDIHAVDLSPKMIDIARRKIQKSDCSNVTFETADTTSVEVFSRYTLIFSDFGGFNCLSAEQIGSFARKASENCSDNTLVVLVLMGKKCLFEDLVYWWQNDVRYKRRRAPAVATQIDHKKFNTYYYTVAEMELFFRNGFDLVKVHPIGFFIPPSYLNPYFRNKKRTLSVLGKLEKLFAVPKLADYSDHYMIIFRKRKTTNF